MATHSHLLKNETAIDFILAGKSTFTLKNNKTESRFTYKVSKCKDKQKEGLFFVKAHVNSAYQYIGYISNNSFRYGSKSHLQKTDLSVTAFEVCFNNILSQRKFHSSLEVWHEGRCGRCGRILTVPESIISGIGPECAKMMQHRHEEKPFEKEAQAWVNRNEKKEFKVIVNL